MLESIFGMIALFALRILLGYLAGFYSIITPFLIYSTIAVSICAALAVLFAVIALIQKLRKGREKT